MVKFGRVLEFNAIHIQNLNRFPKFSEVNSQAARIMENYICFRRLSAGFSDKNSEAEPSKQTERNESYEITSRVETEWRRQRVSTSRWSI